MDLVTVNLLVSLVLAVIVGITSGRGDFGFIAFIFFAFVIAGLQN